MARVTLYKYGCMRLEEEGRSESVLIFCLLEQNKPDSCFGETTVVFSFTCLTANC